MIKVCYSELDGPKGMSCRLEASGHAGYAPAGQDIVCAGASTLMQALVYLLAGEPNAKTDAWDEPDGPRLTVQVDAPCEAWVQGAFEAAKAGFTLLAERYPDNLRFADVSRRGEQSMMDLQLFAAAEATAACGGNREPRLGQRPAEHECRSRHEVGAGSRNPWGAFVLQLFAEGDAAPATPALSEAQTRQAVASGTLKPQAEAPLPMQSAAPAEEPEPPKAEAPAPAEPTPMPPLPRTVQNAVQRLHAQWAAEEAALRRSQPEFSLQKELRDPEMRRLMQLPGMRVQDAYRLVHYNDSLNRAAQAVEQGVVQRIQQRASRPTENGIRPGGAATIHPDVASMTRAQREALERRVLHGAQIEL